ncbi:MAG: hypothetical protein LBU34_08190, partial [Planctomycetaceae bacterium]|nr:hypothetical protein [Planctomycetaceae bacterium]
MYIYESFDPSPFRVHAYRTKEALFLHIIPMSWETCLRQIRLFLITFGSPFLFMIFVALYQGRFADAAGLLFFGIVCQCLLVLCAYLLTCEESLICIDRNTIHKTTWFFGIGSRATLTRPDKITFQRCDGKWCIVTINGNIPFVIRLNIRNHELQWIREIIEQFENEVPVLLPETDSQPVSVSENTEIKNGRRILKNKEYRGQQLRKIPNPAEKHYVNNITKNKLQDELAGTLQVRCPHCHSILPTDFIHADIAAAQCPSCGFLFQVADLKRCPPPRRSSIKLRTEENVLKLHQYPQFFDLPLIYHCLFLVIVHIDLLFVAFCIYIRSINPAATLQEIMETVPKAESMLLVFVLINLFCFLLFLWSIFVHRFVEFRPNNVYFRIRWLCFWRSWTVPRSRLGASRLTFFSHILNLGFQIPYGKKSFPIGAKYFEIPWIVGEINHWLFTHPPEEDFVSDNFPKFENTSLDSFSEAPNNLVIGGVTEINDKETRWRCCDCGHLFLTEELYFPNRNAFCPNCRETFDLSQLRYYAAERIAIKPELPQLSVTESEKEQQIEFSATPINVFE